MRRASCGSCRRSRRTPTISMQLSTKSSRHANKNSMLRSHAGKTPSLGRGVFVAEPCAIIGDVVVGEESSIWYGTVVRGNVKPSQNNARTSIQDNTVIHVTSDFSGTTIGNDCTIGHAAIIHACTVEDFCLLGM